MIFNALYSVLLSRLDKKWQLKLSGILLNTKSKLMNISIIRNQLTQSYPIFIQRVELFNLCQASKELASDTLDRIILQSNVSEVSPISIDDLNVHIFINSISDMKF